LICFFVRSTHAGKDEALAQVAFDGTEVALADVDRRRREEFVRAARHSRLVRFLRVAIPVGCLLAVMLPLAWIFYNPFRLPADVSVENVTISDSKIIMKAPRLTGFKRDNRAYVVNASSAVQDPRQPNIVELHDLVSNIELADNGWAKLQAAFGIYDSKTEKLELDRQVHLRTNSGYDVRTVAARIDFKGGHVVTHNPVKVVMSNGTIDADGMEILDNGKEIVFDGHVVSQFRPRTDDAAAGAKESRQP
jgi:lipopolysaccharide export system protein LptC